MSTRMLQAKRKSDGKIVAAFLESDRNAPFSCPECGDPVILRNGENRVTHFAHATPSACRQDENESDAHRRCKMEIFEALQRAPGVQNVALERPLGSVRPDVSAYIRGVPVAIEVQISSLSLETIMHRTIQYAQKGIYVLWLLQWTPKLDAKRYTPKRWEKWIHAAYFGRVYYWTHGLSVVSYQFEPSIKSVPQKTWYSQAGKRHTTGGFSRRLKRSRTAVRCRTLNLAEDFVPKERLWWEVRGQTSPDRTRHSGRNLRPGFTNRSRRISDFPFCDTVTGGWEGLKPLSEFNSGLSPFPVLIVYLAGA